MDFGSHSAEYKRRRTRLRELRSESLEARRLLAADLWQPVEPDAVDLASETSYIRAIDYQLFELDVNDIGGRLDLAPLEFSTSAGDLPTIEIPNPDGGLDSFFFVESPVMAPELATAYPEIQTFLGYSTSDSATKARFDWTPSGFHAQVLSPSGSYFVDPYFHLSDSPLYASYYLAGEFDVSDLGEVTLGEPHTGHTEHRDEGSGFGQNDASEGLAGNTEARTGSQLRIYRAAVSATGEYTAFHGGTVPSAMAAIVTAMNRVVGVYEQELTIRLELVANNDQVVFVDANSDPFTNNNAGALLGENQTTLDNIIGNSNYDIGHVFSTGAGGLALLGSVGVDPWKAQGATGLSAPTGDPFYIDYVSHEMGHQFGGNHTFNGDSGACAGNASLPTAMEPGSGSTIQAYAGICGNDDLQQNSDPYFHSVSLDEMIAHVDQTIPNVGTRRPTGNAVPFVFAGDDFTIPAGTPFVLTAQGGDVNQGDTLTYNWEQRDVGPQQDVNGGDNGSSPLFRSWAPTESPSRYFPRLADLVNNTTVIGETLPTTNRQLNFRATVRDNRIGAGGVSTDDLRLTVVDTGMPFQVTSHTASATLDGLAVETLTWDVAGTDAAPISSSEVSIYMSTDGGLTYPVTVIENVPNDGSQDIVVPNVATNQARFMVRSADNIFFDISDADLSIVPAPILFDLGGVASDYVENDPAKAIAPNATVDNPSSESYAGLSIAASLLGTPVPGDQIQPISQGLLSFANQSIEYNGQSIGTYTGTSTQFTAVLNQFADDTSAIAVVRAVGFLHNGDNPGAQTRNIQFVFAGGQVEQTTMGVIPTNDSPVILDSLLPAILEDTVNLQGGQISSIFGGSFSDVDNGSSLRGIAIVGSSPDVSEGNWYFSTDGQATWRPVGSVSGLGDSVVLRSDAFLAFLPATNFFGNPSPLMALGLDNTYSGGFSNSTANTRVPLNPIFTQPNGAASQVAAEVNIDVINVNDPPMANSAFLSINVLQGQQVDRVLSSSLFTDIDSPSLNWTLSSGLGVPAWLSFDPLTLALTGTPANRDVGRYLLTLSVSDQEGATASIPMEINVENVNDPPLDLRLSNDEFPEGNQPRLIGRVIALDPDNGDVISWTASDSRFTIQDNELWVTQPIDYEVEQEIGVVLTATDNGVPPLSTSLNVQLRVTDVNEFFPSLDLQDVAIPDGMASGTPILDVDSIDGDFGSVVTYKLKGDDADKFQINSNTGEITIAEPADFGTQAQYRLFVEVTDNGEPSRSRLGQFLVNVTPVNSFAPSATTPQVFHIAENSAPGSVVGTFLATDPDNHGLVYSILNNGDFVINPNNGEISVGAETMLDYETTATYQFVVEVAEDAAPFRTTRANVVVNVDDLEDSPLSVSVDNASVPTGRQGIDVGALVVDDGAGSPSSRYSISTSDARFRLVGEQLSLADNFHFGSADVGTQQLSLLLTDNNGIRPDEVAILNLSVFQAAPWMNLAMPADVSRDGFVSAIDALLVKNELNQTGGGSLSNPRSQAEMEMPDFDVNGDGFLTAIDALIVINQLNNSSSGEAENASEISAKLSAESQWLSAFVEWEVEEKRNRLGWA